MDRISEWMNRWMNTLQMYEYMDGEWMDEWMDEQMSGWVDGWMDEQMDEWMCKWSHLLISLNIRIEQTNHMTHRYLPAFLKNLIKQEKRDTSRLR